MEKFKTLKAAKEAGFKKVSDLTENYFPSKDAIFITVKNHEMVKGTEYYESESAWKKKGRQVVDFDKGKRSRFSFHGRYFTVYPYDATI